MTTDLLSREWPLAPCWAHLLMSQLMCKSFSWPCLWEYRFRELCAQMRLRRSYPAMAVDSCWLLFISVTVIVNFVSIWLDCKVPRCLGNISGCPWIYFWMGKGDFPFTTDMHQSRCWGLRQKEEGKEERIHTSCVISCAGVLVFANLDHLPSSFKHF